MQHIDKAMKQGPATSVMHEWEQVIHHAASATFDSLTSLAIGDDQQLDQVKLMNLLGALAASVGNDARNIATNRAPAVLFEALGPIHFDQVSHSRSKFSNDDERALALKSAIENPQLRTDDQTARINAALLTAPVTEAAASFQPGDVFIHRLVLGTKCPHHHCLIKKRDMVNGFNFKADDVIKTLRQELAKAADGAADDLKNKISLREKEIVNGFHSVLVELTPACDFAQGKRETLRFIGGILVPLEHKKLIPKGDYLRQLPLVTLAEPAGNWILVLNSRFLFGISRPDEKVESKPAFRLRSRVLIDIQAWVASQVARPGFDFL